MSVNSEPTRVSHPFVKKNRLRCMRRHGRFDYCSCVNPLVWPLVSRPSFTAELTDEPLRSEVVLFFFSCHLFPYLHKSCLILWQNLFMKHFKFASWQSGGSAPNPPLGLRSWTPPGLRPGPPRLTPPVLPPAPPATRIPAITAVTQAANFYVLIGQNSIHTSRRKRSSKLA